MIETSRMQSEPMALPDRPFGRIARSVLGYSLLTALMIVTGLPVFIPAALLHCALRHGRRPTWAVVATSMAMAGLYVGMIWASAPAVAGSATIMLAWIALALVVPTMAGVGMVERGMPFGRMLAFLLAVSVAGMMAMEAGARWLLSYSPYAMYAAQAQQTNQQVMEFYRTNGATAEMMRALRMASDIHMFVLPASILVLTAFVFLLSLLMLGRLNAWRELAARRGDAEALGAYLFRNFALPDWLLFGFILGGLTPLVQGMLQKVAANVLVVVVFLYILQGLAIFRFMLIAMNAGLAGTLIGWALLVLLVFTGGMGLLLLGVAGLFDPFFDFRHFKKRKDDSNESHSD